LHPSTIRATVTAAMSWFHLDGPVFPRLVLVAALGAGCTETTHVSTPAAGPSTPTPAAGQRLVVALARLEPGTRVLQIAGALDDRIGRIVVTEGQDVAAGEPLAYGSAHASRLAERQHVASQLDEAKARLEAELAHADALVAQATLARRRVKISRFTVEAREADLHVAKNQQRFAQRQHTSSTRLLRRSTTSTRAHTESELRLARATAAHKKAKLAYDAAVLAADLASAEADNDLVLARAERARVRATIPVASLEAALALADARTAESIVHAPVAGRIFKILGGPGERMGAQPILHMGGTDEMYAVAEVYETEIHRVKRGQSAVITSAALPKPIEGTVESVGLMIFKNDIFGDDPNAPKDGRVFEVRIRLSSNELEARYNNHEVEARIVTGGD